jgi:hypothetical protein
VHVKSVNFCGGRMLLRVYGPELTAQSQAWQKKAPSGVAQNVHPPELKEIFNHHPATGDSDGKDRRRRHENGQGKRSQVC